MADGIEKEFLDDGESKRESKRCSHLGKEVPTLKKQWNVCCKSTHIPFGC